MTTSPYDTLPTGKQALAPISGESIEEKPNPITNPYGGYEEISLEEAARLATPVISQSQDSGSSPKFQRSGVCKAGCVAAGIRARHCYEKITACRISSH